jgi:RNA polymerase sigma factor (sigma-70 family)
VKHTLCGYNKMKPNAVLVVLARAAFVVVEVGDRLPVQPQSTPVDPIIAHNALYALEHRDLVSRAIKGIALPSGAIDRDDLMQEGMLALLMAADSYDASTGKTLAHYAYWKIRSRALAVAATEWRAQRYPLLNVSLDDFLLRWGDVIADVRERCTITWEEVLETMKQCLTEREREIVERIMGLNGYVPRSHAGVGRALGVSQQNVSRILQRARRKLREACAR